MRAVLLVLVLALAALGAWLLLDHGAGPPREHPVVPAPAPETGALARNQPSVAPERAEIEAPADDVPEAGQVSYNLRVVRGATREAVPGAVVRWLPVGFDISAIPEDQRTEDREERAIRHGRSATTDELGRLTVVGPARGLILHARSGDWYREQSVRAWDSESGRALEPEPEYLLELRRDRTLIVRTVDETGAPVPGVSVKLVRIQEWDGEQHDTWFRVPPSDEEGLARWPHVQGLFEYGTPVSASVAALLFGGTGEAVPFDPVEIPEDPIEVVLPPFGSLDVVLLGPDGLPWRDSGTQILVHVVREADASGGASSAESVEIGSEGRALVDPVPCGETLHVRLWRGFRAEQVVAGPRVAGERVRVEFSMPADQVILAGRIVDAGGTPRAGSFFVQLDHDRGMATTQLATDATGRFRAPLDERMVGVTPKVSVRESRDLGGGDLGLRTLTSPLRSGTNDIGDVVVGEAAVLVAGRLEWADGTAVQDRGFQIQLAYAADDGSAGGRTRWRRHENLFPDIQDGGRFVARSGALGPRYRLWVVGDAIVPMPPVEFRPGAEDLVVRVSRGGEVRATVRGESAALLRGLEYRLVPHVPPEGETSEARFQREVRETPSPAVRDDLAECRWTGLPPGAYRLTIACPGTPPLVTLDPVQVPAGRLADDPRLVDIDVRGRFRKVSVTVLDPLGEPVRDRSERESGVMIRGTDSPDVEWYARALNREDGRVELLLPAPADLIAFAPGYRNQEVKGVFGDTAIRLEPSPPVTLRAALPQLPPGVSVMLLAGEVGRAPGRSPRARLVRRPGGWSGSSVERFLGTADQRLSPDDSGAFTLETRAGGTWTLRLELRRRVEGLLRGAFADVQPASLDLASLAGVPSVALTPEAGSLERALDQIGR